MERNGFVQALRQPHRLASTLLAHCVQRDSLLRRLAPRKQHPPSPLPQAPAGPPPEYKVVDAAELRRQAELEQDLQLARDIQQGLLLAAVPHLPGWEMSAVSQPARDLGGDLYDFLTLDDRWHGVMIGDVSGKGLQAALRMAVARTVFRHEARRNDTPETTLAAVNRGVCNDIPHGMVTMLYIMLDPLEGLMRIANAGHTYPLLIVGPAKVEEWELPGMPLGVDPDITYDVETLVVEPGQTIVLYTDGVTEANDEADLMFDLEGLQHLLETNSQLKPRPLMKTLLRELRNWSKNAPQSDDITVVVLRRRLSNLTAELRSIAADVLTEEKAAPFWAEIETKFKDSLPEATADDWTDQMLPELTKLAKNQLGRGLARELVQQIRLVVEEYR